MADIIPHSVNFDGAPRASGWPNIESLLEVELNADVLKENGIVGFFAGHSQARAFHILRTQVMKRALSHEYRVIGVVSAAPSAGKTFIATNLAAALSQNPQLEVYYLDLDFRNPSVARVLGMEIEHGLESLLRDESFPMAEVGRRVSGTNLAVFPTIREMRGSTALIQSEKFGSLMAEARKFGKNRIVICDLPPVLAGDDAMLSVQNLDAYLMVAAADKTTARQVTESLALLDGTPCLGSILNRYSGGVFDTYGYGAYSDKYSQYYSEDEYQ